MPRPSASFESPNASEGQPRPASSTSSAEPADLSRERYVVVLKDFVAMQSLGSLALRLAQDFDGRLARTYQDALKAFSLDLTPASARALRRDPRVATVDRVRVRPRERVAEGPSEPLTDPRGRTLGRSGTGPVGLTLGRPAELG